MAKMQENVNVLIMEKQELEKQLEGKSHLPSTTSSSSNTPQTGIQPHLQQQPIGPLDQGIHSKMCYTCGSMLTNVSSITTVAPSQPPIPPPPPPSSSPSIPISSPPLLHPSRPTPPGTPPQPPNTNSDIPFTTTSSRGGGPSSSSTPLYMPPHQLPVEADAYFASPLPAHRSTAGMHPPSFTPSARSKTQNMMTHGHNPQGRVQVVKYTY